MVAAPSQWRSDMPDTALSSFRDLSPAGDDFLGDVIAGLSSRPKTLPCKYFYDERGSQLFDQICALPEYYPTRTETALMKEKAAEMSAAFGPEVQVLEYGCGSIEKVRVLLDALERPASYIAVDISREHLRDAAEILAQDYPAIEVHAIYEPEQEGAADRFDLTKKNGEEDARADALASSLGLKKVGMVFNVSTSAARDYTLSAFEVRTMAECQARYGPAFVTAVVMMLEDEDENGETTKSVSFEPFQVSEQCVGLFKDGWFAEDAAEDAGLTRLNKEVIVVDKVSKDVTEVDNDRFLVPVKILDHAGPLATTFPVENRLHPIQTAEDLRDALRRSAAPYAERLRDFHLLLFLSKHLDAADMRMVATQANKPGGEIQEGHKIIIDSIAGM